MLLSLEGNTKQNCEVEVPLPLFESATASGLLPRQFVCTVRLRYPYHCLSQPQPLGSLPRQFACTVRLRYPYHCLSQPRPVYHCPGSLPALWGWGILTIVWVSHSLWIIVRAVWLHCEVEIPLPLFESATTCESLPGQFVCTVRLRYPYHCFSQPQLVDHCPGSLSALWGWGTLTIVWVSHNWWIIARAVCLHCKVEVPLPLFESVTTCGSLPGQFVCTVRLRYPYHCLSRPDLWIIARAVCLHCEVEVPLPLFESARPVDHCPGSLSALWGWGALTIVWVSQNCGSLPGQFVCTVRLRYPHHCLSPPRPVNHCPDSLSALWGWGTLTIVWVSHIMWIIAQAVCLHCEVEVPSPLFESAKACGSLPGQFACTVRLRYPYHCLSRPRPVDHCPGSLSALWGLGALPLFEPATTCGSLPGQFVCTVRLRCLTIVWVRHALWIIARAVCLHCEVEVPLPLFESAMPCGSLPGQFVCTVRLRYSYHCLSQSQLVDHCLGSLPVLWGPGYTLLLLGCLPWLMLCRLLFGSLSNSTASHLCNSC